MLPNPVESNNILQMKTTFKKAKPKNKLGVSTHSGSYHKSINYNYNNCQKPQHCSKDYNIPSITSRKTNIICYIWYEKGRKSFQYRTKKRKDFCQNINLFQKAKTYFFTLEYDIVSGKGNLLVDCGATKHVITDKSKIINCDQNFEPGNHFVELADGSWVNNIVLKRGNACIYLRNSNGHIYRCILKNALYIPHFKQNMFSIQAATKKWCEYKFWAWQLPFNLPWWSTFQYNTVRMSILSEKYRFCQKCHLHTWHKI